MKQKLNEVYFVEQSDLDNSVKDDNGIMIIKGVILQRAESKNKNNRVYPRGILDREMNKLLPTAKSRSLFGELDHPEDRLQVYLKEGSHLITDMFWDPTDQNILRGDVEILKTPIGQLVEAYVKQKCRVGISSRGEGSLIKNQDYSIVDEDYECYTFDIVANQSTFGAILNEAIENGKLPNCNKFVDPILENYYKNFKKNQDLLFEQIEKILG